MPIILFPSRCWKKLGRLLKASLKARPRATMYTLEYSAASPTSPWTEDRNSIDDAEGAEQMSFHIPSPTLYIPDLYAPGGSGDPWGGAVGLNPQLVLPPRPQQDRDCRRWRPLRFPEAAAWRRAALRIGCEQPAAGDGFAQSGISQLWGFRISIAAQVISSWVSKR